MMVALMPMTLGIMMGLYACCGETRTRHWVLALHGGQLGLTVLDIGAGRGLMIIGAARKSQYCVVQVIHI